MRKLLIVLFVLLNILTFGQQMPGKNIYTDVIYLPDGSNIRCFLTYRISYDQLVFVKKNSEFEANIRFSVEAVDSADNSIKREIKEKSISVDSYDKTTKEDLFVQGFVEFETTPVNFKVIPIYTDNNSGYEQRLKEYYFKKDDFNAIPVFKPIIVKSNKKTSEKNPAWNISNFNGTVPFSSDDISLILVVKDTTLNELDCEILNNDSTLLNEKIHKYTSGSLEVKDSSGAIKLIESNSNCCSNIFILKDISAKAHEGNLTVKVKANNKTVTFNTKVEWFLKPATLQNEEYARKVLLYISDEADISKIKSASTVGDYSSFFDFWKKFDPTPETTFNELMNEYYTRADYAIINYSLLGKTNGAETDRGKIYILYGKPDDISRAYISSNDIAETWIYKSPRNKFIFRDKTGTGNFILESHQ